jgi:hypothetical protein
VCSLVFTVPIGAWLNHDHVDHRGVGASILTVGGLVLFLVGQPSEGIDEPTAVRWWCAATVALVAVVSLARIGTRRRGSLAGAVLGCGAGLAFGFQAAVSKMFANELGGGVVGLLTSWSTWVLILSVATGFAVQQAALKTGSLATVVATTNTTTLLTSVVLGVFLFEEHFARGAGHLVVALLGLALTISGIASLAGFVGATKGTAGAPPDVETPRRIRANRARGILPGQLRPPRPHRTRLERRMCRARSTPRNPCQCVTAQPRGARRKPRARRR